MRYFFDIAYDGTNYHGWQIQPNAISVQEVITDRLSKLTGSEIEIVGSGRTDAGVHAKQQVFHVDLEIDDIENFRFKLNRFLPADIAVNQILPVTDAAHARFDALRRSYIYVFTTGKDPFTDQFAWNVSFVPDVELLNELSAPLMGRQDFKSFSKVKTDVSHYMCEISNANWSLKGNVLEFHISADRFLRGMVRAIVGTLLELYQANGNKESLQHIIDKEDRRQAGSAAPAKGLFLSEVSYPKNLFL